MPIARYCRLPTIALMLTMVVRQKSATAEEPTARLMSALAAGKLIDLTHVFDEKTIYWPTEKGFVFERGNNGVTAKGYYYAANRFFAGGSGAPLRIIAVVP